MPLYLTASHSSRVRKPGSAAGVTSSASRNNKRKSSASSPNSGLSRTKSGQRGKSLAGAWDDGASDEDGENDEGVEGETRLDATGKILPPTVLLSSGSGDANVTNVLDAIQYSSRNMFTELPTERAGMNSTRIAEVLNFRKSLPHVVSVAHVHALLPASTTKTEREIATLVQIGKVRRIKLTGRGNDISGLSEVLVATTELEKALRATPGLNEGTIDAFMQVLIQNPKSTSFDPISLSALHATALIKAGFLVSSSLSGGSRNSNLGGASIVAPATVSRAASGTWAAVGGEAAFENLGGVGTARRSGQEMERLTSGNELALSLPDVGPYLRLLNNARTHLLGLLARSKYREAPLYLLRERWDGAIESDSRVSRAKRVRGEFAGILPGKTKKWKDLHGLSFDWALEECLGAGLVELFETRSVGHGVRAL